MSDKPGTYSVTLLNVGVWHVAYTGRITLEVRAAALTDYMEQKADAPSAGIVVDLRHADLDFSLLDAFEWGNRLASEPQLQGIKIAFLEDPANSARSQFIETVARNRGGATRVMTDWDRVMEWLSDDPD